MGYDERLFNITCENLIMNGCKEQECGSQSIGNTFGTNFLTPDGAIITVMVNYCPDNETLKEIFGAGSND